MGDDLFNDDFFKEFKDKQLHHEFQSSSFDDAFKRHHDDFNKSFATAEKVFWIFFSLVVIFIVGGFILAIILICIRICKGESA